jgi:hypothetical protein
MCQLKSTKANYKVSMSRDQPPIKYRSLNVISGPTCLVIPFLNAYFLKHDSITVYTIYCHQQDLLIIHYCCIGIDITIAFNYIW